MFLCREQERKLWLLVSPGALRQMVTWGSPSFESGRSEAESTPVFALLLVERPFDVFAHQCRRVVTAGQQGGA